MKSIQPILQRPNSSSGPHILAVDDNQIILDVISDFLGMHHFRVTTTRTGQEFLELLPLLRPDLVLVDIQMPGMDGLEVIQQIRAHADARLADLPVIAVTALAMAGDRERCLAAGANDYLSKPLQLEELLKLVRRFCPPV